MAKQELNLFQFAASGTAEASAISAEIVRRKFAHASLGSKFLDEIPDELFSHPFAPNATSATREGTGDRWRSPRPSSSRPPDHVPNPGPVISE